MTRTIAVGGSLVVVADGPEVLVWDRGGAPRFAHLWTDPLVAVAVDGDVVCAVDTRGTLVRWTARGEEIERKPLGERVSDFVVGPGGACAWTRPDAVGCSSGGTTRDLPVEASHVVAWGADGRLAVGCLDGRLAVTDAAGTAVAVVQLDGRPTGLCAGPTGDWFVTVGNQLVRVQADGRAILRSYALPGRGAWPSASGPLVAIPLPRDRVVLFDAAAERVLGAVGTRRAVVSAAFAGPTDLWVVVDDGEVARVDLATGEVGRAEAHRGRERATVSVGLEVDPAAIRGALAAARTGGRAVATIVHPKADARAWWAGLGIVLTAAALLCLGCAGLLGALWWWRG